VIGLGVDRRGMTVPIGGKESVVASTGGRLGECLRCFCLLCEGFARRGCWPLGTPRPMGLVALLKGGVFPAGRRVFVVSPLERKQSTDAGSSREHSEVNFGFFLFSCFCRVLVLFVTRGGDGFFFWVPF